MTRGRQGFTLPRIARFQPNREPLGKRLPLRDADGRFLADFMMLLPGLRDRDRGDFEARLAVLEAVLGAHADVVFADLNAPRNLLWVSVRARHGVIGEVAAAIRRCLPEAKLIGHAFADATPGRKLDGSIHGQCGVRRRGLRWWRRDDI